MTEVDVDVDFQVASLPVGFTVDGTIPVPPSLVRQYPTFDVSTFSGFNCSGAASDDDSCVEMRFILTPGPLVPVDGNFVLDFNNTDSYTAEDLEILNGTYTGGDDPNGTGGWAPGGAGSIQPAAVVPEPSYRATAGIMGLALLAAWNYRRRLIAKKS